MRAIIHDVWPIRLQYVKDTEPDYTVVITDWENRLYKSSWYIHKNIYLYFNWGRALIETAMWPTAIFELQEGEIMLKEVFLVTEYKDKLLSFLI